MELSLIRSLAAALFLLLAPAAHAAEEPEAVYGKFHRAVASGNLQEMLRYAPEARRAEIAAMTAAEKDAVLKMMNVLMPRAYLLRDKALDADGRGARLVVSGPSQPLPGEKPETLYGTIRMVMERGEWKVGDAVWSNEQPHLLSRARPAAPPATQKAPASAPAARGAPVVGSMSSAPERKLGTAKEPCVYKPVMTAEDLERCR